MIPKKLYGGGHVRIIAPANSVLPKLTSDIIERGITRLNSLGLEVSFGKHIREVNDFKTASVRSRLADLHEAFLDSSVDAVLALSGVRRPISYYPISIIGSLKKIQNLYAVSPTLLPY